MSTHLTNIVNRLTCYCNDDSFTRAWSFVTLSLATYAHPHENKGILHLWIWWKRVNISLVLLKVQCTPRGSYQFTCLTLFQAALSLSRVRQTYHDDWRFCSPRHFLTQNSKHPSLPDSILCGWSCFFYPLNLTSTWIKKSTVSSDEIRWLLGRAGSYLPEWSEARHESRSKQLILHRFFDRQSQVFSSRKSSWILLKSLFSERMNERSSTQ